MTRRALPYPPPWQDISTLSAHICAGESTIEVWSRQGILPAPRMVGGKRMWRWSDVERYLAGTGDDVPASPMEQAERIKNGTRREIEALRRDR